MTTETTKHPLTDLIMSFYEGEPCRICGEEITHNDLDTLVWAGCSADDKARTAHKECWDSQLDKSEWVHK